MKRTTHKLTLALLLAAGSQITPVHAQMMTEAMPDAASAGIAAATDAAQVADIAPVVDGIATAIDTNISAEPDMPAYAGGSFGLERAARWSKANPQVVAKIRGQLQQFRNILQSQPKEDRMPDKLLARKSLAVGFALGKFSRTHAESLSSADQDALKAVKSKFFKRRAAYFTDADNHDQARAKLQATMKHVTHLFKRFEHHADNDQTERSARRVARLAKRKASQFSVKAGLKRLKARISPEEFADLKEQAQEEAAQIAPEVAQKIADRIQPRLEKRIARHKLNELGWQYLREQRAAAGTHAHDDLEVMPEPTAPPMDDKNDEDNKTDDDTNKDALVSHDDDDTDVTQGDDNDDNNSDDDNGGSSHDNDDNNGDDNSDDDTKDDEDADEKSE